jgi:hypothetical protein
MGLIVKIDAVIRALRFSISRQICYLSEVFVESVNGGLRLTVDNIEVGLFVVPV